MLHRYDEIGEIAADCLFDALVESFTEDRERARRLAQAFAEVIRQRTPKARWSAVVARRAG